MRGNSVVQNTIEVLQGMTTPAVNESTDGYSFRTRAYWSHPSQVAPDVSSVSSWSSSYGRQRPASVTSPFRTDHTRAPTDWSHLWWVATPIIGEITAVSGTFRGVVQGPWSSMPSLAEIAPEGFDDRLYDKAVMQLLKNLKNSKVNLGVALAEARKTAELLGTNGARLAHSLDAMMSRNVSKIGKMLSWKKIPQAFLEWSYGAVPLLNDIYGSAQALAEMQVNGYDLSFKALGRARKEDIRVTTGNVLDFTAQLDYNVKYTEQQSFHVVAVLPDNLLPVFSSLGLTNPLEVAWEIVPYSFVLDWIVPIGDWLSVLDASAYLSFKEGSYSRIQRYRSVGFSNLHSDVGYTFSGVRGRFTVDGGRMYRSVLHDFPAPPIFPRLRSPLSLDKAAKGLSLLASSFKRWS